MKTRIDRLTLMLEKYRDEENKRRMEGRIEEAEKLRIAVIRTESALEEEKRK